MRRDQETILIVDDERPTLDMLSLFLDAYGFRVLTAESGEEGVEVFDKNRPQIVITDIKMPGMDGLEFLKRVKKIDSGAEVIVVTGHGDMDLAIQALNLSATDFINKPVRKDALEAALKRAGERIAQGRQAENRIEFSETAGVAVLDVDGNVTSRSEAPLQEAYNRLIAEGRVKVVMRFKDNATINGAGIALLTQLLLEGDKKGLSIAVCGVSENFRKVFEIVGITKFAKVFPDLETAAKALA